MSRSDIARLYQLLLGRAPESEQAIDEKVDTEVHSLIADMIESEEFEDRVLTPAAKGAAEAWMYEPLNDYKLRWLNAALAAKLPPGAGLAEILTTLAASETSETRHASKLMRLGGALLARPPATTLNPPSLTDRDIVVTSGLWDASFYLNQVNKASDSDPLDMFVRGTEWRDPHPLFRTSFYNSSNPDVRAAGVNALVHYLRHGDAEDRWPNPLFSPDWYRRAHHVPPERSALAHFANEGAGRGAKPHPLFDGEAYLARYADVREARLDPYVHYIRHGFAEGRLLPSPRSGSSLRTAVLVHAFHAKVWPELLWRLQRVSAPYALYVTVPETDAALRTQIVRDRQDAVILPVANRGRDLGALLQAWPVMERDGIDLVCKAHTKVGGNEPDTWRHILLEGVLGPEVFAHVQDAFREDEFLTLAGPQQVYLNGERWTNADERGHLERMLLTCGAPEPEPASPSWGFFAGSCFWLRLSAFRCVGALSSEIVEASNSEREGQRAHALERLFGALAARRADRVGFTDVGGARVSGALTVRRAPGPSFNDDFPAYLRRRTPELASVQAEVRISQRRAWTVPPDRPPGVTFVGPVEAVNGLGVSARGFVRAIQASGVPLDVMPWRLGFDRVRHEAFDAPSLGPQPINLVHLNLDLMHSGRLLERAPLNALVQEACFNVLVISWELLSLPPEWTGVLDVFDEVWASSRFMVTGVRSVSRTPVRVVRPALAEPACVDPLPIAPGRFLFGYIADSGSLLRRKNPERLWRTYGETFAPSDGAALVIKLHYSEVEDPLFREAQALARDREDVVLISESLSEQALASLTTRINAYVSPHRSEGLGLTIVEAMMSGKPVICTDFGGCTEFADEFTAFPVARRLTRVGEGAAPYPPDAVWADPLAASLAEQMKRVFKDRAAATLVAAEGRKRVHSMFSTTVAAAGMRAEIRRIWLAGGGSEATFDNAVALRAG